MAKLFLPPFPDALHAQHEGATEELDEFHTLLNLKTWKGLITPLIFNIVIIGCALTLSQQVGGSAQTATAIVTLTLLSLTASFMARIRTTVGTYPLGMYLILLFCTISGAMFSTTLLEQATFELLLFFLLLAIGAIILHLTLCRLLNIDADTFLITSVAAILSPPFVPLAASVMHNRAVLLSGMSAGVLGYAVGNLLGLFTYWLIQQVI